MDEKNSTNRLLPRMISQTLTSKTTMDDYEASKKEEEMFTTFHDDASSPGYTTNICQCELLKDAIQALNEKGIIWEGYKHVCDCKKTTILPIPKDKFEQDDLSVLDDTLVDGILDFLYHSKISVPSMDQPGHGACVVTGAVKWTWDTELLKSINDAY